MTTKSVCSLTFALVVLGAGAPSAPASAAKPPALPPLATKAKTTDDVAPMPAAAETSSALTTAADREWDALKLFGKPDPAPSAPGKKDVAAAAQARAVEEAKYLDRADRLKNFYNKHPDHAAAKEAKRLEAFALLYAAGAGDRTQETRRQNLVREVRADPAIPGKDRYEVAALADHFEVNWKRLPPQERLDAFERVERGLIEEFPDLPFGYESLLRLAADGTDANAPRLAQEVIGLDAPAHLKAEAQTLLDRYALVGQSLAGLMRPIVGDFAGLRQDRPCQILLYTWATWSKGSLAAARALATEAPAGAILIGVNLDTETVPAQKVAQQERLPGVQYYDWHGRQSALALKLKLTTAPLVYLTDGQGIIRSVSARRIVFATAAGLKAP